MSTNVWITGIGVVSSAGGNVASTLENFKLGLRRPVMTLPFESSVACPTFQVDAELEELPEEVNGSRTLRLAMHVVRQALGEAQIGSFGQGVRVGVCMGTTVACNLNSVAFYDEYRKTGIAPLQTVRDYLQTNLAQAISKLIGARGPRMTIVNACSSGTDAVAVASSWIQAGLCDVAIAGGADELHRVPLAGFWSLGVMSLEPCTPFDRDRAGLNLGEGAGVVLLESGAHAEARGRTKTIEVAGFGTACDAHHLTAPHPDGRGLETAVRMALGQARATANEVGFINAHGTATLDNDRAESKVIARLFGPEPTYLSTKGYTGHTLGAAGGVEAAFTVLGLREGWVPASVGFVQQGEDIPVAPTRERTKVDRRFAMSTSLAFGGNNSALLLRRDH